MTKTRTLLSTLMLLALATLAAVTVTPTASAHYCEGRTPQACGDCTPPGPHEHYIYVSDSTKILWCYSPPPPSLGQACEILAEFGVYTDC